jgi:hypothetical protein
MDEAERDEGAITERENAEFEQLVGEMRPLGFTRSKEVSTYIINNRLGYKYKTISGVLEMELNGTKWKFEGGFPPRIFARLCLELGLEGQGTEARPGKFESFDSLNKNKRRFSRKRRFS